MPRASDLTAEEQKHVRVALRYLHLRFGGWRPTAKALRMCESMLMHAIGGRRTVTPTMAFRAARLVGASIDDLLTGKYLPPGACAHCGHVESGDA